MTRQPGTLRLVLIGACTALMGTLMPQPLTAQTQPATLCAVVQLQISQTVTLERQAFSASLTINNTLATALTNLQVQVLVANSSGTQTNSAFFINISSLTGTNAVDGTGVVQPNSSASANWLMIPSSGTGGTNPAGQQYAITAMITAQSAGSPQGLTTFPVTITVQPQPLLNLQYVLPSEVFGQEPLTPNIITPPIPFPLGLRVTNIGYGPANNFQITSAQPQITDNAQGLIENFNLIGTVINGQPSANALLVNFGTLPPQGTGIAQWTMTTSLSGYFINFTSTFTHAAALGGAQTSLLQGVTTFTLLNTVLDDQPGHDSVPDYLVNGSALRSSITYTMDGGLQPPAELMLESDRSTATPVTTTLGNLTGALSGSNAALNFAFAAPVTSNTWNYGYAPFAYGSSATVTSATRSDGKILSPYNFWVSKHFVKSTLSYIYWLNVFDYAGASSTPTYTIQFNPNGLSQPPAAAANFVTATGSQGGSLSLNWTSPGDSGNSGVIVGGQYMIQAATDPAAAFAPSLAQVNLTTTASPGDAEGFVLNGLAGNATYYLRLWTQNAEGLISPISAAATSYVLANPPASIAFLSASSAALAESWLPGNNLPPVAYDIALSTSLGGAFVSSSPFAASSSTYIFAGLAPNTSYFAYGLAGNPATGSTSAPAFLGVGLTSAAAPVAGAFSNIAVSSLTANWGSNGNPADTQFLVELSTTPDQVTPTFSSGWVTGSSYTFTGLTVEAVYYGRVKARSRAAVETAYTELGLAQSYAFTITPASGQPGASFVLTGAAFGPYANSNTRVRFGAGGALAAVSSWSNSRIVGTVPMLSTGTYPVIVERQNGASTATVMGESFAVLPAPSTGVVLALSPFDGDEIATSTPTISADYVSTLGVDTTTVHLTLDGAAVAAFVTSSSASFIPVAALADGTHTVTASVADLGANVSTSAATFLVDTIDPVTTLALDGLSPSTATLTALTTDVFTLNATDAGSGVAGTEFFLDVNPFTCNLDVFIDTAPQGSCANPFYAAPFSLSLGTHTISYFSFDGADNVEGVDAAYVTVLSTTPPVFHQSYSWIGAAGDGLWSTPGNWSPTGVPGTANADTAVIATRDTVQISTASPAVSIFSLVLGDSSGVSAPVLVVSSGLTVSGAVVLYTGAVMSQNSLLKLHFGSINLQTGAGLTHTANTVIKQYSLNLAVSGDFVMQQGSSITLDGLGYSGFSNGYGAGPGGAIASYNTLGGGGHGGPGCNVFNTLGGPAYDSVVYPTDLGSASANGNAGGGAVILDVHGTLTLNGTITANAQPNPNNGTTFGGGAGGTINIRASSLNGSGTLQVNGANGDTGRGGGGGGRIAVVVWQVDSSSLTVSANSGQSGPAAQSLFGGAGTLYFRRAGQATLTVSNVSPAGFATVISSGNTGTSTLSLSALNIVNSMTILDNSLAAAIGGVNFGGPGSVLTVGSMTVAGSMIIPNGATLVQASTTALTLGGLTMQAGSNVTHLANTAVSLYAVNLNVAGNVIVPSGAAIIGDGLGYAGGPAASNGFGFGDGSGSGTNGGGGGGFGGLGGIGQGGTPGGMAYGTVAAPDDLGSGGGGSNGVAGGAGGGEITLSVSGTLTVNGSVSVNGAAGVGTGGYGGGGGSGGTLRLTAGTFAGNGLISANGGSGGIGSASNGGGGAGGRISGASAFTGIVAASGGNGSVQGQSGTSFNSTIPIPSTSGVSSLTSVSASGFTANWNANGNSTNAFYWAEVSPYPNFAASVTSTITAATSVAFTGLLSNTSYYAHVAAMNGGLRVTDFISLGSVMTSRQSGETWIGPDGGDWNNPANWDNGAVPTSSDTVRIDQNLTVMTYATGLAVAFGSLNIGDPSGSYSPTLVLSTGAATIGAVTIYVGGSLIQNTTTQILVSSMTMYGGSKLAHAPNVISRQSVVNIKTLDDFVMMVGSSITLDGLGYTGSYNGYGSGPGGPVVGAEGLGGGGHGGPGCSVFNVPGGLAYDSVVYPSDLGSASANGNSGGGAAMLDVRGTLTLNGLITANAQPNPNNGTTFAGGAGGTINIRANSLNGSGTLQVNGASGDTGRGGGAGGRIAVVVWQVDSSSLTLGAISGQSGPAAQSLFAGAGTIYFKRAGQAALTVANVSPADFMTVISSGNTGTTTLSLSTLNVFNSLTTLDNSLGAAIGGVNFGGPGSVLTVGSMTVAASMIIPNGAALVQASSTALTLGGLTMQAGSNITHLANAGVRLYAVNLSVTGDANVPAGAAIISDGLGYAGGPIASNGSGPGDGSGSGTNGGGGGGYGGLGGIGQGGTLGGVAYGNVAVPDDVGSGGGGSNGVAGGAGGGEITLSVSGILTVNGSVSANGAAGGGGGYGGGGGSGGTLRLAVGGFAGIGLLSANGGPGGIGSASNGGGGGGAGGRITGASAFTGTVAASGGNGAVQGQSGTSFNSTIVIPSTNVASAFTSIFASSFTANWNANGNSANALYWAEVSPTANFSASVTSTITATTSVVFTGLLSNTSYYAHVATMNGGLRATDFISLGSLMTARQPGETWIGADGGDWNNPLNWDNGAVPTSSDTVRIDQNSTVMTYSTGSAVAFAYLNLGDAAALFSPTLVLSTGAASIGAVTIYPGGSLIQNTTTQIFLSSMTMYGGSKLAHAPNVISRQSVVNIKTLEDFVMQAGSSITLDGLGYTGSYNGYGSGPGGPVVGAEGLGGGGHGGPGCSVFNVPGGLAYDSVVYPSDLGSASANGNSGGGAAILDVHGTLTLNGLITANAQPNPNNGTTFAGGAGGTINIRASSLNGSGTLQVNGAYGDTGRGGGAGGRIAVVVWQVDNSSLTLAANSGQSGPAAQSLFGGAGTIYFKRAGQAALTVANVSPAGFVTVISSGNTGTTTLSLSTLNVVNSLTTLDNSLGASIGGANFGGPGSVLTVGNMTVAGNMIIPNGAALVQASTTALTLGGLTMQAGSNITHLANAGVRLYAVNLSVMQNADIQSGAAIIVDGLGYGGGSSATNGLGSGAGNGSSTVGGDGGGYGGVGGIGEGDSFGGVTYGSGNYPNDLGSGGGGSNGVAGGSGGGEVTLSVYGQLTIDGTVSANGASGAAGADYGGGGGSGGTIRLSAGELAGAGLLSADGGAGGAESDHGGGGGGGGRISFAGLYPGTGSVLGGLGGGAAQNGFAGTIGTPGAPVTTLWIDSQPVSGGSYAVTSTDTLSLVAADSASSVSGTFYVIDVDPFSPGCESTPLNPSAPSGSCGNESYAGPFSLSGGTHTIYYFSEDYAGNQEPENVSLFTVVPIIISQSTTTLEGLPVVTVQSTASYTITDISTASQTGAVYLATAAAEGLSPVGDVFVISPSSAPGAVVDVSFIFNPVGIDPTKVAIYHFDGVSWSSAVVSGQALTALPGGLDQITGQALLTSPFGVFIPRSLPPVAPQLSVTSVIPSSATTGANFMAAVTGTSFDASAALSLQQSAVARGTWTATGSFTQPREEGSLTKLLDGRVLQAGGSVEGALAYGLPNADVYNPLTGTWTAAPPMSQGRAQLPAVLLADGRVLVSGGQDGATVASAEIYDPVANTWTTVASMTHQRLGHSLTLMASGRVLAAGGYDGANYLNTAEIYDPVANTWTSVPSMSVARAFNEAVALNSGKVLVTGGTNGITTYATAEAYDPVANAWSPAGTMSAERFYHQAALLPNGKVLASGGGGVGSMTNTADIYDPATNAWTATVPMSVPRYFHRMVLVNGMPLVIGGENDVTNTDFATTEFYDPASNSWRLGPSLTESRTLVEAVALNDGRVLVAAGRHGMGGGITLNTAELLTMPVSSVTATGVAVSNAQNLSGRLNLAGAATGYWDVAVNESGYRVARLSGGFQVLGLQDVTPPVTTLSFSTPSYVASSTPTAIGTASSLTLTAVDISSGGVPASGVIATYYAVDVATAISAYAAPFTLPAGAHTVFYHSVDIAGNVEATSSAAFAVYAGPFIGSVAPSSGPIGVTETFAGFNFGSRSGTKTQVLFAASTATISSWNDAQIAVKVPDLSTGPVALTIVALQNGTTVSVAAGTFTVTAPQIFSIVPSSGPIGITFTLSGQSFGVNGGAAYSQVLFGGATTQISSWNDSSIVALVPGFASPATYPVVVQRAASGGTSQSNAVTFVVTGMTLSSVSPSTGPADASIVLSGVNFGTRSGGNTQVLIGGTSAQISAWSDSSITAVVPVLSTAAYSVIVERIQGAGVALSNALTFTETALSLTAPVPATLPMGADFTLSGPGFGARDGANTVLLVGGVPAQIKTWNDTTISGTVPTLAAGSQPVSIERISGTALESSNTVYLQVDVPAIAAISPSSGPIGVTVTLTGMGGFGDASGANTVVVIGGSTVPFTLWNDTTVQFTVPSGLAVGTTTVALERIASDGGIVLSNAVGFQSLNIGLAGISPSMGPIDTSFTLTGSGFGARSGNNTQVLIGGATAQITSWNDSAIVGVVPALSTGAYSVAVQRVQGSGFELSNVASFTVTAPQVASITPSSAPIGGAFTITGTSLGARDGNNTLVLFGGVPATITSWSNTSIVGKLPGALSSGTVSVAVEIISGSGFVQAAAPNFLVVVPTITAITPNYGLSGTVVNLYGAGFGASAGTATLLYVGTSTVPFSIWNDENIRWAVPATLASGIYTVTVVRSPAGGTVSSNVVYYTVGTTALHAMFVSASASVPTPLAALPVSYFQGDVTFPFDQGGSIVTPSLAAVSVPAGALAQDTEITLAQGANLFTSDRAATLVAGKLAPAGEPVDFGPEGTQFSAPATITLPYDPALVSDSALTTLAIQYYDPVAKTWTALTSRVDPINHVVSALTNHFSLYQPLVPATAVASASLDAFGLRAYYVFPNPVRGTRLATIRIQPGLADSVEVHVYDLAGRRVLSSAGFQFTSGLDDLNGLGPQDTYDYFWDVSGIGSGVYTYVITAKKAGFADIHVSGKIGVVK